MAPGWAPPIFEDVREVFAAIVPWATLVFAVSSMLAAGLGHSMRAILRPLRRWPRVLVALGTNFVFSPALAYLLARLLALDREQELGLFLIGAAAGAPFLLKLAQIAGADVAFAASLLVLLLPATVFYLPFVVPLVEPRAQVSGSAIGLPLLFSMLGPLALGMLLRPLIPRLAATLGPILSRFATAALIVTFLATFIAYTPAIVGIGAPAIIAIFALVLGDFLLGLFFGARIPRTREVLALATGLRNIGAATVVATQTFGGMQDVLVMVAAAAVAGMLVLFPLAFALRHGGPALLRRRHA